MDKVAVGERIIKKQNRLINRLEKRIDYLEGKEFYYSIYDIGHKDGWNDCLKKQGVK